MIPFVRFNIVFILLCLCGVLSAQAQKPSFPYPAIPPVLQTPQARGAYLLEHYWDNYNFQDTTLIHKPDITEQGFANFLDLLPRMDSTAAVKGIQVFVAKVFGDSDKTPVGVAQKARGSLKAVPANVRQYFAKEIGHYLYDPNSPLRSDELYILFLREMVEAPAFDEAEKERYAFQLKNVAKNLPGTKAADFTYIDRQGNRRTLYTTAGDYTLLYINDPDCENCHATTELLRKDSLLTANPRLTVLAIYPDVETEEWRKHPQPFPVSWIDAYSPEGEISSRLLYFIRATPTLYLLDKDKRVLLKDPSPALLQAYVKQLFSAH